MLKVRLQGTLNDIRWFKGLLERNEQVKVQEVSEPFTNKGTNKYFRVYAEIDKKEEKSRRKIYVQSNRNRKSEGRSR